MSHDHSFFICWFGAFLIMLKTVVQLNINIQYHCEIQSFINLKWPFLINVISWKIYNFLKNPTHSTLLNVSVCFKANRHGRKAKKKRENLSTHYSSHHNGKVLFLSRPILFLLMVVEQGTASRWWELLGRVGTHWLFFFAFCSLSSQTELQQSPI